MDIVAIELAKRFSDLRENFVHPGTDKQGHGTGRVSLGEVTLAERDVLVSALRFYVDYEEV